MYFLCIFSKFLRYFTKILYINTSISKILAAGVELTTIRLLPRLYAIRPSRPHYEIMILFDFHALSVKSFNRKRRHIGIRIFIQIIYYPITGYPESKLSVLSIPISYTGRVIANFVPNFVAMATGVGRSNIWLTPVDSPTPKIPYHMQTSKRYLLNKPSYSQLCPKFRCHGNRGWSWQNLAGIIQ